MGNKPNDEIARKAEDLEREFGPDVEEAISRWEETGASLREPNSSGWLSVAFKFARRLRNFREL
jgi:hypothetical protein